MFRLGKNSLNTLSTIIHSDTLFSALVINYILLYGEAESGENGEVLSLAHFIALFEEGKVKISSAFHCIEKKETQEVNGEQVEVSQYLYFLPKPDAYNLKEEDENHKATKKVAFLSKDVWGENPYTSSYDNLVGGTHAISLEEKKSFGLDQLKRGKILADVKLTGETFMPKVVVHKRTQEDSYYSVSNVQLTPIPLKEKQFRPVHFYFLLEKNGLTSLQEKRLKACIYLLEDEGIGGERSVGCGRIERVVCENWVEVEAAEKDFPFNAQCTLSLTIPKDDADFHRYKYYKLVKRGGSAIGKGTSNEYARKQVRMVKEGAIVSEGVEGHIEDISPKKGKMICRYGKALTIGAYLPNSKTNAENHVKQQ